MLNLIASTTKGHTHFLAVLYVAALVAANTSIAHRAIQAEVIIDCNSLPGLACSE